MRPDLPAELLIAEKQDAATVAREQFVHGLLEALRDTDAAREERVQRLMARLEAPLPIAHAAEEHRPLRAAVGGTGWRFPRRLMTGMAAAVALVAVTLLGLPTERSAMAMVQDSLRASDRVGDRRYEIRVVPPRETTEREEPVGRVDVRDREHVVVSMSSPNGDTVVRGRNGGEEWAVRPDGTIDRFGGAPKRMMPPWADFGTSTVLVASVDELLGDVGKRYDLRRGHAESLDKGRNAGATCDRITALRRGPGPDPDRVELWLDQGTRVVRRMELHWKPRPGPGGAGGEGGRRPPPDGEFRPERRPEGGPLPEGERPPRRGPGPDGRPRPRPEGEGMREEGRPPRPRPEGAPPPEDRLPMGPRPPRRPPPDGERPAPEGGRRPGGRPQFLGEPPDFDRGRHAPPPRALVFDLVDSAPFDAGWFDAAAHAPARN